MAEVKDLIVYGSSNMIGESFADIIHANSFKTNGGTSLQFVKGDGTLDSNEYVTTTSLGTTLDGYVHRTGSVTENITGIKKFESNVWLYSASGDTPALVFQRGEDNNYIDWKVYNTGGILKFSANRNAGGTYTDLFTLNGDSSHQDAYLYLNLISTGTATFGTSPNTVSIGSGNVTASGSVNSLSVNSTTVNIADSGSLSFVKTSSNEDIGPYINGDYDSTNNEPILTFYGSYGDEPVRLTNVADPINAQDSATKNYVNDAIATSISDKQDKLIAGTDLEIVPVSSVLPTGYTQLDFIESTGTQCIDTGYALTDTDILEIDYELTNLTPGTNDKYIARQYPYTWIETYGNTNQWYVRFGSSSSVNTAYQSSHKQGTLVLKKNVFAINGTTVLTPTYNSIGTGGTLTLFGVSGSTSCAYIRISEARIKNSSNTTIHTYIPARQNSNQSVGMYDVTPSGVTSQGFLSNINTGSSFIAGSVTQTGNAVINFTNDTGYTTNIGTVTGIKIGSAGTTINPDSSTGVVTLPIASNSTLGSIKVGSGLTIDSTTGVLSATGGGGGSTVIEYVGDTITFDGTTPTTITPVSRTVNCVSATGSSSTGKGTAVVKSFKGNGCTSWNQIVVNGNFADYNRSWTVLPHGWTASSTTYFGSYCTIGKISDGDDGFSIYWNTAYSSNAYMYQANTALLKNHIYYVSCWRRSNAATYISMYNSTTLRTSATFAADTTGGYYNTTVTSTTLTTSSPRLAVRVNAPAVGTYLEIRDLFMVDLTEMFGSGNEPTAAEFAALYPMNYYDYCGSTLVGCKNMGLASIGYNILMNGDTAIAPAGTYKIEGTYTSVSFINLYDRTDKTQLTVTNGEFTTTSAGYIYVAGYDPNTTCVHRSGTKTGYETPWINRVQIDTDGLTGVRNGTVSTIFPYGMMSVGNVYDEIPSDDNGVATTAIKRIGIRDYASGDENDLSVVTNRTITAYELSDEETYVLEHPINMTISTDEYGIEAVSPLDTFGRTGPISSVALSTLYYDTPVRNTGIEDDKRNIEDSRIQGIDSVPTQGSPNLVMSGGIKDYIGKRGIFYAVVTGQASSSVKNAVCPEFTVDDLKPGVMVVVRFTSSNTYTSTLSNICLDINGTGRYGIKKYQMTYTPGAGSYSPSGGGPVALSTYRELAAASYPFVFTGNEWVMIGPAYNSTYANYSFGNGYAVDSRTGETPSLTEITATYGHSTSTNYSLSNNGIIGVHFKYDVGTNATLNISGKGAKPIIYHSAPITGGVIKAGDTATFFYTTFSGVTDYEDGYVLMSIDPRPASISVPYLPLSGGTMLGTGNINMNGTKVVGMSAGTDPEDAVIVNQTIVVDTSDLNDNYTANNKRIKSVATPTLETDAANKLYVDSRVTTPTLSVQDISQNQLDGTVDFNIATVWVTPDHSSSQSNYINFTNKMKPGTICHIMLHSSRSNIDSPALNNYYSGTVDVKIPRNIRVWDSTDAYNGDYEAVWINGELMMHGQLSDNTSMSGQGKKITIPAYGFVEISVMYVEEGFKIEKPGAEEDVVMHRTIIKVDSPVVNYDDTYTPES